MNDTYNLQRFVDAQYPVYKEVLSELREGRKRGHWMWFIFPQIKGLGRSYLADKFAISSLEEGNCYLKYPILGPRLQECSRLVMLVQGSPIDHIFGYPDNLKFFSSMTLFAHATPRNNIFNDALKKYYEGNYDRMTLERL